MKDPATTPRSFRQREPKFKGAFGKAPVLGGLGTTKQGPRYRGPITQKRLDAQDLMRQLSLACKYLVRKERDGAEEIADDTQLYWRDIIFQTLSGRFMTFWDTDGNGYYSMASQADVSQLLDAISQALGSVLFRGPNLWEPTPPGAPGYVLTLQDTDGPVVWAPAATGTSVYVSTLKTTVGGTASATWPKYVNWDTPVIDENAIFNATNPNRIMFPAGASLIRVSYGLIMTNSTGINAFSTLADDTGAIRYDYGAYDSNRNGNNGFSNNQRTIVGPWLPPPTDTDYLQVRITASPANSGSWLADSFLTLEAR